MSIVYQEYIANQGERATLLQRQELQRAITNLYKSDDKFSYPNTNSSLIIWIIALEVEDGADEGGEVEGGEVEVEVERKPQKVVGSLIAGIYPSDNCIRPDQWYFTENMFRSCWIERIDVDEDYRKLGIGSELVSRAEHLFDQHQDNIPKESRSNYYVVSIPDAIPFYLKNGYDLITTEDNKESDDPWCYQLDTAQWMAKPFKPGQLDRETLHFSMISERGMLDEWVVKRIPDPDQLDEKYYIKYIQGQEEEDESPLGILYCLSSYAGSEQMQKLYDRLIHVLTKMKMTIPNQIDLYQNALPQVVTWAQSVC